MAIDTPTPAQQLEACVSASNPIDFELECQLLMLHADTLRRALAALEAVECDCATKVNQVCDKCCAKTEAVWLMPVATMEPQNGKLLQYAHGRSHLSTGQMAHAYQCIVEAAKECGQIIPADAVEVKS